MKKTILVFFIMLLLFLVAGCSSDDNDLRYYRTYDKKTRDFINHEQYIER